MFLYLTEQHGHPWFDRLDVDTLDLGVGNRFGGADATRTIVAAGRLDSKYKITVPVGLGSN